MARPKKSKKIKLEEPKRKISDAVLMKMLEPHMQESISDIADIYQKLSSQLGLKFMQFTERVSVNSSVSNNEHVVDTAAKIAKWREECGRRRFDSRTVMLIIADGMNLSEVARKLKISVEWVKLHVRACLTVWSVWQRRCSLQEVSIHAKHLNAAGALAKKR